MPSVIAIGNIHIGTMAGKLNGVTPATTPSGSRRASHVTPRETSRAAPSSRFGRLRRVVDDLEAALDSRERLGRCLAALERDRVREVRRVLGHEVVEASEGPDPLLDGGRGPGGERAARRLDGRRDVGGVREANRADDAPV